MQSFQERLEDAAALDGIPTADRRTGHGTALNNLARRLYLTYGDAAQISFESGPNGTCVPHPAAAVNLHEGRRRP